MPVRWFLFLLFVGCSFRVNLLRAEPNTSSAIMPRGNPVIYSGSLLTPDPQLQHHQLDLAAPVWRGDKDTFLLSTRLGYRHTEETLTFEDSTVLPSTFWNVEFGGNWIRRRENGDSIGGRLSLGSASDALFSGRNSETLMASAFYSLADGEDTRWTFSLFFTNNNPFLPPIPIPGVAYTYTPNDRFMISVGMPFLFLRWRFFDDTRFEIACLGPTMARIDLHTPLVGKLRAGVVFNLAQQLYLRKARPVAEERLYFDDKRVGFALRHPLMGPLEAEFQTGYAFGRRVFESKSYYRTSNAISRLPDGLYLNAALRLNLEAL